MKSGSSGQMMLSKGLLVQPASFTQVCSMVGEPPSVQGSPAGPGLQQEPSSRENKGGIRTASSCSSEAQPLRHFIKHTTHSAFTAKTWKQLPTA